MEACYCTVPNYYCHGDHVGGLPPCFVDFDLVVSSVHPAVMLEQRWQSKCATWQNSQIEFYKIYRVHHQVSFKQDTLNCTGRPDRANIPCPTIAANRPIAASSALTRENTEAGLDYWLPGDVANWIAANGWSNPRRPQDAVQKGLVLRKQNLTKSPDSAQCSLKPALSRQGVKTVAVCCNRVCCNSTSHGLVACYRSYS